MTVDGGVMENILIDNNFNGKRGNSVFHHIRYPGEAI